MNFCAVCGVPSNLKCAACNLQYYCGKQHQKQQWKSHKTNCLMYKVESNCQMGRFLVATRDIKAGRTISSKDPYMVGPKMASKPICLGCHRLINSFATASFCSGCKWPICSSECEKSKWHLEECRFLRRIKAPDVTDCNQLVPIYSLIIPLRVLLMKQQNFAVFEELMALETHFESRKSTQLYRLLEKTLLPALQQIKMDFDKEEPLIICSIFDTNSYEIRNDFTNVRAVYPVISLISHDCTTNTKHIFNAETFEMQVIATKDIKKGEIISTTYTQTLWPTIKRRQHLMASKAFLCQCKRCLDPTELGLYVGSLRCSECKTGYLISKDPSNDQSLWICTSCAFLIDSEAYNSMNSLIRDSISKAPRSVEGFEQLLKYFQRLNLHETNTHVLETKYALLQLLENDKNLKSNERIHSLSNDLLKVAEILEPGCSLFKEKLEKLLNN